MKFLCAQCRNAVWTYNDLSFRALPSQHAGRWKMHQSQSAQNVSPAKAQSRDLNHHGLKTNADVLTHKYCGECDQRKRAQEEKCGLCGVGIFTTRSGVRLRWIMRGTHFFLLGAIVDLFFSWPRCVPLRTRPPSIPWRRRRRRWVCLLLFLPEVSLRLFSVVHVLCVWDRIGQITRRPTVRKAVRGVTRSKEHSTET